MSLIDRLSDTNSVEQKFAKGHSLKIPGLVTELSPVKQLDFFESPSQPSAEDEFPQLDFPAQSFVGEGVAEPVTGSVRSVSGPVISPGMALLPDLMLPPAVTRQLAETGALIPVGRSHMTNTRHPVVIR